MYQQSGGAVEEKAIANGRKTNACGHHITLDAEKVGVLAFHQKAAGVVGQIAEPCFELPRTKQELVVITTGKEHSVGAVFASAVFTWCGLGLLRWQRNRRDRRDRRDSGQPQHQLTVMTVAALLESAQRQSKRLFHFLPNEKDAMQMVGHHL